MDIVWWYKCEMCIYDHIQMQSNRHSTYSFIWLKLSKDIQGDLFWLVAFDCWLPLRFFEMKSDKSHRTSEVGDSCRGSFFWHKRHVEKDQHGSTHLCLCWLCQESLPKSRYKHLAPRCWALATRELASPKRTSKHVNSTTNNTDNHSQS